MSVEIAVVTPSYNAADTIDRTILSVVSQAGNFSLRFHVQDGGSTDGTVELLKRWQQRLRRRDFPIQCREVSFTWSSEGDEGMYDALAKGLSRLEGTPEQFMTWINADDLLLTGALAFVANVERQFSSEWVSWLGGAVAIMQDDMIIKSHDRPLPTKAVAAGLCDGRHWPFVQQEGTFFRRWLWDEVDGQRLLPTFRLAGDWALWQRFAGHALLVQAHIPLGAFRLRQGQLSASQRDSYLAEIARVVSVADREEALRALATGQDVIRRTICSSYPEGVLSLFDESTRHEAVSRHRSCFGEAPPKFEGEAPRPRAHVKTGVVPETSAPMPDAQRPLIRMPGIIGLDAEWQFPAVTEQHAFRCLAARGLDLPHAPVYVAFPWATLIDKLQTRAADADDLMAELERVCNIPTQGRRKFTVCQHIFARKYQYLFDKAGIADVFWPHTTLTDLRDDTPHGTDIRFHPFPLFPVQTPDALPAASAEADGAPRPHLYSFIGARANSWYLTQSRNWILDLLGDDPRGNVRGRDGWHYQRVVYDGQILKNALEQPEALIDAAASEEFRDALTGSVFALCPSGTGPNSIRLWESLAAGTIPVILADDWAPPGDRRLWEQAAIFCPETPEAIAALPDQLGQIAAEPQRIAAMRHAMRQIWLLYGAPTFVTDLLNFILSNATTAADAQPFGAAEALLVDWSGRLLVDPAAALDEIEASGELVATLAGERARIVEQRIGEHFDAVLRRALQVTRRDLPGLSPERLALHVPAIQRVAAPRLCLFGRHACRTPLSYQPLRRHIGERIRLVSEPEQADLVVTGFDLDFREHASRIAALAAKGTRLAVISEEPLWDITWSGAPQGRRNDLTQAGITLEYAHLAHGNSEIFDFEILPYYPMTDDSFVMRYASLIERQAKRSPAELLAHWRDASLPAAFIAEYRTEARYRHEGPMGDIVRLSAYRTELAKRMLPHGALCLGKGWGHEARRQELFDWHLDKLARLHDRCLLMGAQENIHLNGYISEKPFDAFACGAIPVCFAGPRHRLFELIPQAAMVNTYGKEVEEAALHLKDFSPDAEMAEAWLDSARRLSALFGDFRIVEAERARIADALVTEVMCHV
ncbi:exostosin domain-containing protein [Paracoccus sp. (in: a-proteobacteria)]|uniref:exostosin domain-containing protein n=1 Tax=Paracoccus sp. TaxID=267 RepID=UPI00272B8C11|nr:exostosin family protein [Paracoccus sp. (in: a-proteobacteria)]